MDRPEMTLTSGFFQQAGKAKEQFFSRGFIAVLCLFHHCFDGHHITCGEKPVFRGLALGYRVGLFSTGSKLLLTGRSGIVIFLLAACRNREEGEQMEQFLIYAANYGFPMVVTAFLLVRIEGKIDTLNASIGLLTRAIEHRN